jgi:hypothetical protein
MQFQKYFGRSLETDRVFAVMYYWIYSDFSNT